MYQTGYHSTGYYATGYYLPDVQVIIPPITGGGGSGPGIGLPGENYYNQAPPKYKDPFNLEQALQEDEEMLLMIKAFVETIQWH